MNKFLLVSSFACYSMFGMQTQPLTHQEQLDQLLIVETLQLAETDKAKIETLAQLLHETDPKLRTHDICARAEKLFDSNPEIMLAFVSKHIPAQEIASN